MIATIGKTPKPVSIDFVLSDDLSDTLKRLAALGGSKDPRAKESADAISTALEQKLPAGIYHGEKKEGEWYFTPQSQSYVLSRSNP